MAIEETKDISTSPFPTILGDLVYYRTYSELLTDECTGKLRLQTWDENAARNATFIAKLGELTNEQRYSIYKLQRDLVVTPPGRVLWAAKDEWVDRDGLANYLGLFNCVGIRPTSWKWFGYNFLLLMMGCGVGAVIEEEVIYELPPINSTVPEVTVVSKPGDYPYRPEDTTYIVTDSTLTIKVGDSKEGWVDSYVKLLTTCSDPYMSHITHIDIELGGVRPNGTPIKGFGGTANPIALAPLYENVIKILKGAAGRNITSYEACLLLNWAALTTVAGNIRRSARWDGYSHGSPTMTGAKEGVWECDPDTGEWRINPEKDVLRMVNISAIMHTKPTPEQCLESVRKQHQTGEGALWYAPAALVRANADLLPTDREKRAFESAYTLLGKETARAYLRSKLHENGSLNVERELEHRMTRYGANPCCFVAGTMVLTREGHYPIETLVDKGEVEVWDGEQWVGTTFHITGENQPVYEVLMSDGSSITATGYHKFILDDERVMTLLELMPGDVLMEHDATPEVVKEPLPYKGSAYLKGFLLGDGTSAQGGPLLHVYPTKEMCKDRLVESCNKYHTEYVVPKPGTFQPLTEVGWRESKKGWWMQGLSRHKALLPWVTTYRKGLPPECYNWSLEEKCDFIAGYFDADGTAMDTKQSYGYQVTSVSLQLLLDVQLLLTTMGIKSHVNRKGQGGGLRNFNDGYGEYVCNDVYRISLSQSSSIALSKMVTFTRLASFSSRTAKYNRRKPVSIVSIESKGIADKVYCCTVPTNHSVSLSNGIRTGQCEIIGRDFVCSLSQVELGTVDVKSPTLWEDINEALDTASLIVCSLLKRGFAIPELQWSREMDPIVAVTLNGVFDFMVNYFGEPWLRWWMAGCPPYWNDPLHSWDGEQSHLSQWFMQETERILNSFRDRVRDTVVAYCTLHNLTIPNRYTAMQPSGSKSTVTGGTPACYTPKGMYWIRRVTLRREHPVALAAIDYGYRVIPSSSCKDDNGNLLDDPYDERVQEWFVEIPCRCTWSSQIKGEYAVERAPITSQWYLTMACQKHYVTHNTSVTFEINEHEIPTLAKLIYDEIQAGGDYISGAIFSRDSSTMPRMPYEPISMEEYHAMVYDAEQRRKGNNFKELAEYYYNVDTSAESGPTIGCDGDSCTIPSMPQ